MFSLLFLFLNIDYIVGFLFILGVFAVEVLFLLVAELVALLLLLLLLLLLFVVVVVVVLKMCCPYLN